MNTGSSLRPLHEHADEAAALAPLIAITGGGTGGHVYPGLAVAASLAGGGSTSTPLARVAYLGTTKGLERELCARAGIPFEAVASGALVGKGPASRAGAMLRLGLGTLQALRIIRRDGVRAILATGGYVSAPVVLAGYLARVPSMLYLPDVVPGLAVRFLSRFARRVAVTAEQSRPFLPAETVVVTGYPLRPELLAADRAAGRTLLDLRPEDRVLLVLGGSRGAHSINTAVAKMLADLLPLAVVLHSSGPQDEPWLRTAAAELPAALRSRYRLSAYLHEDLAPAMAAADLALSRAGASTMGEYPSCGLPAVLVPYPHAGAHQNHNAAFLVSAGAALKLSDAEVAAGALLPMLPELLGDRPRLAAMSAAARALARPNAAQLIAEELLRLCSKT